MSSRRSESTCAIMGPYKELVNRQLPTISDAIKFILFVKNELKLKYNGEDSSNSDMYEIVSEKINHIWTKALITIVTKKRVIQLLKSYFEKYLNLKRYPKSK